MPDISTEELDKIIATQISEDIETVINKVNKLSNSRHKSLVITKLEEARLWINDYSKNI